MGQPVQLVLAIVYQWNAMMIHRVDFGAFRGLIDALLVDSTA